MPCDSSGYSPSSYECEIKETVKLLCYVYSWLNITVSDELYKATNEQTFFDKKQGDKWVNELCRALSDIPEDERYQLIYDNRVRLSRRLADWWEDHVEADAQRLEIEKRNEKRKALQTFALSKLTKEEREVLGL